MSEHPPAAVIPPRQLSAGCVVVRPFPEGWRFLVLRAYRNWDFPKGEIEPDEEPRAAAVREVWEEARLGDLRFDWGDDYRETLPYARNKVARYYLALSPGDRVTLPVAEDLGRPEHDEFRWLTVDEAEEVLPPRLAIVLDWAVEKLRG